MELVLEGQIERFDELVNRHRAPLLRAAVSKMRDQASAEDVVQDTFLAAFARRKTFNPEYSFRGWLWTIGLNTAKTHLVRERRRSQRLIEVASTIPEQVSKETGLGVLLQNERSEVLAQMLAQIPEAEADALRMRFFGELQFNEIAHAMAISLNGARKRVRRGLERLTALLSEYEGSLSEHEDSCFDGEAS